MVTKYFKLTRVSNVDTYCKGMLTFDGKDIGLTREREDLMFTSDMTEGYILKNKKVNACCVPTGEYDLILLFSPKFKTTKLYLVDVKGFAFIMFHEGYLLGDSKGCILTGLDDKRGGICMTKIVNNLILNKYAKAIEEGYKVKLIIERLY